MASKIHLLGRVFVTGDIHVVTGLHIGAGSAGLNIGGLDNPVVRDPLTRRPYIPGSSLKGKMRSLSERTRGFNPDDKTQIQDIGQVRIHVCQDEKSYAECNVCQVFGLPGEKKYSGPTRLIVRDVFLDPRSLEGAHTDFPFAEVKWEASIDRVTSAALPRQIERVPAGAVFQDFEMVFSLYDLGGETSNEIDRLGTLFAAMQMVEDDFLGGSGSRGSGKIAFERINLSFRKDADKKPYEGAKDVSLEGLLAKKCDILKWVSDQIGKG